MSCRAPGSSAGDMYHGLPTCIQMTDSQFSLVTSFFTIGGLLGSLLGGPLTERQGRKGALKSAAVFTTAGAGIMTV